MASLFEAELSQRLEALRRQGLYRQLRTLDSPQQTRISAEGRTLLNFSSNDYLGLANHPVLKAAAAAAVNRFGSGSGASRLICGSLTPHAELESALAEFKGTEASLAFSTGYAAAAGVITALVGPGDIAVIDKRVHACIVDAVRLSGATLRVFKHNDLADLERILKWAAAERASKITEIRNEGDCDRTGALRQILLISESVFSMDGDLAPLSDLVDLKERYGAWLMIDEAHATGLFGEHRRGLVEAMKVSSQVEIQMGTMGKAIGASGGYVTGARVLVDWLINRARSFIFSTAPPPAAVAAARAGIEIIRSSDGEQRRQALWSRVNRLKETLIESGLQLPAIQSSILPVIVGEESRAMSLSEHLRHCGLLIPAIRYPTVSRGQARLRITATSEHSMADIESLGRAFRQASTTFASVSPAIS